MAEMTITFPGGKRVNAEVGGRVIATDQPREEGGEDTAPAPYLLFLAALGTCAGVYVLGFCQARGIDTTGIRIEQSMEYEPVTDILKRVRMEIHVPPSFPAKYHAALVRVADGCAVKKAVQAQPQFEVKTVVDA
jgi:putative redox protein